MRPFDSSGAFHPIAEGHSLRRAAVRGAGVTVFASAVAFVVQMAATVILARLLTPSDFGIVTMVTTFSLFFSSFGLNGFTEAILQREEITHFLVSNLFWINIAAAAFLTVVFALLGPLIALFYHDPLVVRVVEGMSLTIIAASFSVIHLALLKRALGFTAVAVNAIVARIVSVLVSIGLALAGWGYWSLVAGLVAQQLSISIGAWIQCSWTPSLPRRVPGTAAVVKFALNVYSHFGFYYATGNTDNLLVGWRYNAAALGLYKKAFDLFYLPANQLTSPISSVVIATLSRFNRDRAQYCRYFLAGISFLALVGMGVGADLTLIGRDVIRVVLGPAWDESGRIFVFFGPGIGVMMLYGTQSWIHLSIGRPDRWFRWGVFEFLCTVSLFLIALPWGPRAVALAWTTSYFLLMTPAFWYAGKPIDFGISTVLPVIWKFFIAALAATCASLALIHVWPPFGTTPGGLGAFARCVSVSAIFFALYLAAVVALNRGTEPLRHAGRILGDMLPQHRTAQTASPDSIPAPADASESAANVSAQESATFPPRSLPVGKRVNVPEGS